MWFFLKQKTYVNIKQIKTDKKIETHHTQKHNTQDSANPSHPLAPRFTTFLRVPQRSDCIGEVTVLNQENESKRQFVKVCTQVVGAGRGASLHPKTQHGPAGTVRCPGHCDGASPCPRGGAALEKDKKCTDTLRHRQIVVQVTS